MLEHPESLLTLLGVPILAAAAVALAQFWRNERQAFEGSIKIGFLAVASGLAVFAAYWTLRLAIHLLPHDLLSQFAPEAVHVVVGHGVTFIMVILVALGLAVGSRGTLRLIDRLKQQDVHLRRAQRQAKIEYWR